MSQFVREDRWEQIILFSHEGLKMASAGRSPVYHEDRLLEGALSLQDAARIIQPETPVQEFEIRGRQGRRLLFRFFPAGHDTLAVAVVVRGRKGYRRAMARMIRSIQERIGASGT